MVVAVLKGNAVSPQYIEKRSLAWVRVGDHPDRLSLSIRSDHPAALFSRRKLPAQVGPAPALGNTWQMQLDVQTSLSAGDRVTRVARAQDRWRMMSIMHGIQFGYRKGMEEKLSYNHIWHRPPLKASSTTRPHRYDTERRRLSLVDAVIEKQPSLHESEKVFATRENSRDMLAAVVDDLYLPSW